MKKKILSCLLVLVVAISFMPTSAFAASKAKMTSYYQVYKTGKTVYAAGAKGIYKVTVKKGKVKKVKMFHYTGHPMGPDSYIYGMKKKGKYLYYVVGSEGMLWSICRKKTSGKGFKLLVNTNSDEFAIKGKKIYYVYTYETDYGDEIATYRVMKLNGKSNKKTSTRVSMTSKRSNTSKYSVIIKEHNGYARDYLKTPKGTYYLGRVKIDGWD